jgi:hypothetical protein
MIQSASTCRSIFSFSIAPFNPAIVQTLYQKKVPLNASSPQKKDAQQSWGRADSANPPERLSGFFTPYRAFSSNLAAPQYDPEHLPQEVIKVNVCISDQVEAALEDVEKSIKAELLEIFRFFEADEHSRGLGLQIAHAGKLKRLYLHKG